VNDQLHAPAALLLLRIHDTHCTPRLGPQFWSRYQAEEKNFWSLLGHGKAPFGQVGWVNIIIIGKGKGHPITGHEGPTGGVEV
jgi:hypothetical protein